MDHPRPRGARRGRAGGQGHPHLGSHGNYVIDARFPRGIDDARATERWLNALPGVVENGLFVGMTHLVIVGQDDGSRHLLNKS